MPPADGHRKPASTWDTADVPEATMFTDKGARFSMSQTTGYPPRADVARSLNGGDSVSVSMYKQMNPFDAVSQPTPVGGMPTQAGMACAVDARRRQLRDLDRGVEGIRHEHDVQHDRVSIATGRAVVELRRSVSRSQPSIVYSVPFTIGPSATTPRSRPTTRATAIRTAPMERSGLRTPRSRPPHRDRVRRASSWSPTATTCIAGASTSSSNPRASYPGAPTQLTPKPRSWTRAPRACRSWRPAVKGARKRSGHRLYEVALSRERRDDARQLHRLDAGHRRNQCSPTPAGALETFELSGLFAADGLLGLWQLSNARTPTQ